MKPLVNPVINLNGNSAEDLTEKLIAVLGAIRPLADAMAKASDVCHGRNFQTANRNAVGWIGDQPVAVQAQQAWGERRAMLQQLEHDITNMALDIQRQKRERER